MNYVRFVLYNIPAKQQKFLPDFKRYVTIGDFHVEGSFAIAKLYWRIFRHFFTF